MGAYLTDKEVWGEYWKRHVETLPLEVTHSAGHQVRAILGIFREYADVNAEHRVLEVGGAPGRFLAYLRRTIGCRCAVLDFSPVGCDLTRRNFELLQLPIDVYERDLFAPDSEIGSFDLVYSLGVVEHFSDITAAVAAHIRLARPGGLLIVGTPNLLGVSGWFARRLNPPRVAECELDSMRLETWDRFERELGLTRVFRSHVGGFDPLVFAHGALPDSPATLRFAARVLVRAFANNRLLRKFDHPLISGYLIGVWRVP